MPFSFDLSESVSGAGNSPRGSPPGNVRRSCPSPSIYRNPRPAREIRPAGRRRAAFVGHALLLRSIGIRAPAREIRPVGRRRAVFVDHALLLRSIGIRARRGKFAPWVAAGQRSSVMPFSFDLSESAPGAGNPSRGSPPGSVRRSCPSPSIYRNPCPAREIRPAGRRRAAFVDHFVLLRFIGIRVRRGKSVPRVAAGQRSSVMPFSFDLSESTPGAGNPSRGSPPGSVRRSFRSPSIYRNPCPARGIRPAGRCRAAFVGHALLLRSIGIRVRRGQSVPRVFIRKRRRAAFVDHFVLLRFIGIRVRRGKFAPWVVAGQCSSIMAFPSQCGSKSDKYREISPRGAKNLLFSGRNLRFSIKIYMF